MILLFSVSCFLQDEDDETVPVGDNNLTVKATYIGSTTVENGATGKIFVYLFQTLGTNARTGVIYKGSTDTPITPLSESAIVMSNIAPGDYYVLTFYDCASGSNIDNKGDIYVLYKSSKCTKDATKISITSDITISENFDDSNSLQQNSSFMTCP